MNASPLKPAETKSKVATSAFDVDSVISPDLKTKGKRPTKYQESSFNLTDDNKMDNLSLNFTQGVKNKLALRQGMSTDRDNAGGFSLRSSENLDSPVAVGPRREKSLRKSKDSATRIQMHPFKKSNT